MTQDRARGTSSALAEELRRAQEAIETGHHEAAHIICQELVGSYPDSAEAHAGLADVYAARRMWSEAVEWYTLAVQLGAGPVVMRRLARARERLAGYSVDDVGEVRQTEVQRQRVRLWWVFGGAAAAVVLGIIIIVIAMWSPPEPTVSITAPSATRQTAVRPATAPPSPSRVVLPPRPRQSSLPAQPSPPSRSQQRPERPATPAIVHQSPPRGPGREEREPVIVTRQILGPISDRDEHIARSASSLTWPDDTPMTDAVGAMMDPYTGYVMITFQIPRALEVQELFAAVMRQAYAIAATALRTDAGIQSLTVRAVANVTSPNEEEQSVVAFRANTDRTTLEYWLKLHAEPTVEQLWEAVFADSWWNPIVPHDRLE